MSLEPGAHLGPYEILGPLGSGGMGEVYRARDPRLAREVAVKVLRADSSDDEMRLRRFEQESKAAGALNHPNLLVVFDTGSHEGAPYIVFELLHGTTLRERLVPGSLPTRKAVEYAVQIAHGLAAAHQAGIVHRDLKPENVFVTDDGRQDPRLRLGQAASGRPRGQPRVGCPASAITEVGAVLGTAGYMSPEQVQGETADLRSDIFSFGSVCYEMLSGRRAFRGASRIETMSAILKEDPPDLPQAIPPAIDHIVRRCLEKERKERFQSARDVALALEAVSEARRRIWPRSFRPVGRRFLVAAFAVAGLAALTVWLWPAPSPPRVTGYTQITSDLVAKWGPVTDGSRVYFSELPHAGVSVLAQVATSGGDVARIAAPFEAPVVVDVSPNASNLLVLVGRGPVGSVSTGEVWIVPVVGGTPHRVGDLSANGAAWSPDGREIAYTTGSELFVASSDGIRFPQDLVGSR